jgi:hypothetical protein
MELSELGVTVEIRHDIKKTFKMRFNGMTPRRILESGEEYLHCHLAFERSFFSSRFQHFYLLHTSFEFTSRWCRFLLGMQGTNLPFAVVAGSTQNRKHVAVVLGIARLVIPRSKWLPMSRQPLCFLVAA